MSRTELDLAREAARALAEQQGRGLRRQDLVALAGGADAPVSVYAGDPPVAVIGSAAGSGPRWATLTQREREVAALVAAGHANAEIAARLVISVATVKDHVHHVLAKSGLPNRVAIAAHWHR